MRYTINHPTPKIYIERHAENVSSSNTKYSSRNQEMDPESDFGWDHFGKNIIGRGIFHSHAPLKHFEYCVECSVHFLFIFLFKSCGISLKKCFYNTECYHLGDHGPSDPLGSALGRNNYEFR